VIGGTRVEGVFARREDAEARLRELDRAARPLRNDPDLFWSWSVNRPLSDLSDFEPGVFLDWLTDAGIPLPQKTDFHGWYGWWEEHRDSLTAYQRTRLFEGLHRFSFHEILEIDWHDGDDVDWEQEDPLPAPAPYDEDDIRAELNPYNPQEDNLEAMPPRDERPQDEIPF
jgi:hypothetical protein